MGNLVLSFGPSWLPQGAVLSASALHSRLEGQRNPTDPIVLPSSPWPWTASAAMAAAESARVVRIVLERILEYGGIARLRG